MKEVTEEIR
jgi:hypothetical protein